MSITKKTSHPTVTWLRRLFGIDNTFKPSEIAPKVDAQLLDEDELTRLFEPNEDISEIVNGEIRLCSYDRVADPDRTYYLVAERGVGKTHILRLLQNQLEIYGHSVLTIKLEHSEIMTSLERLKTKHPTEGMSTLWQLAILEEVLINLFETYIKISFIPSPAYKLFQWTVTHSLLRKYESFFAYIETYRPEVANSFRMQLRIKKIILWKYFPQIEISLPTIGNITFKFDASNFIKSDKNDEPAELEIGTRMKILSTSIWESLKTRKNGNPLPYINKEDLFTRTLPVYKSIYVIADGLDQTEKPLSHDDLLGLVEAVKILNMEASQKLGSKPNFKAIMAIRSVTFDYVIARQNKLSDLAQIRPQIERLKWSKKSLKRLMARRILNLPSNSPLSPDQVEEAVNKHFPGPVHFFGKTFNSSVDFIFEVIGSRPRPLLSYWLVSAEHVGSKDHPYKPVYSPNDLISALKKYAEDVSNDLAAEYDLEYKGLHFLLNHLSSHSEDIRRVNKKVSFVKVVEECLPEVLKLDEIKDDSKSRWLASETRNILEVLYKVGVIGLPVSNKVDRKADWIESNYSSTDSKKAVVAYENIVIHPVFWSWITNIKNETLYRRRFSFNLYNEFHNSILDLSSHIQSVLQDGSSLEKTYQEYIIGKFLALTKSVLGYRNYPEPLDYDLASNVIKTVDRSLILFSKTILCPAGIQQSNKRVEEMINYYSGTMLAYVPNYKRNKIKFNDESTFQIKISESLMEHAKVAPPLLSLNKISPQECQLLQEFDNCLIVGDDSLNVAVVKAIQTWTPLR